MFCLSLRFLLKRSGVQLVPPPKRRLRLSALVALAELLRGSKEQPLVKRAEYKPLLGLFAVPLLTLASHGGKRPLTRRLTDEMPKLGLDLKHYLPTQLPFPCPICPHFSVHSREIRGKVTPLSVLCCRSWEELQRSWSLSPVRECGLLQPHGN